MSDIVYFLAAGQSNMVGNTRTNDTTVNPNIEIWNPYTNAWEVARISDELDPVTGMHTGASIAFSTAQNYQTQHGGTVRLIIDCEGGRPLDDWLLADKHQNDGIRYDSLAAQHEAAGAPKIDAFIFAQGEANRDGASQNRTTINSQAEYETGILSLFDQLCSDRILSYDSWIMMPELIKVAGSESYDRNDVISNLSDLNLANLHTLETDHTNEDLVRGDAVHWNTDGIHDVGERAADLLDQLQADGPKTLTARTAEDYYDGNVVVSYLASTERVAVNLTTGTGSLGLALNDSFGKISGVVGSRNNDYLKGGRHDDAFMGDRSDDEIYGEGGEDLLFGGSGKDRLEGGPGKDRLFGGDGNDWVDGGRLNDILTGGQGRDTFYFNQKSGRDRVSDFVVGEDRIDLTALHKFTGSSFEQLQSLMTYHPEAINTVIAIAEVEIRLWSVEMSDLTASDFIL